MYQPVLKFDQNVDPNLTRHHVKSSDIFNPNQLPISFPMSTGAPALAPQQQPPANRPALAGATGNARGSMRQPALMQMPNQRIGLGEAMIRMGGAGMAGASQGGLASMGAMTDAYGGIMDYNRAREMEEYQMQQEMAAEEQRRKDALAARMASSNKKAVANDPEAIAGVRQQIAKLQNALDSFNADEDSSLTGFNLAALLSRAVGATIGNTDEAARLFLNEVRLDSVMQRVAETKGAISNAEMALFASQAPDINSNAVVWKSWLNRQLRLQEMVLRRLQTGETIDPNAPLDPSLAGPTSSPAPTVSEDILNEADSIVNGV